MVAFSIVSGVAIAVLGKHLPTSYNPINAAAIAMTLVAEILLLLSGIALTAARAYASGDLLRVADARRLLRLLLIYWIGMIFVAMLSCFFLTAAVNGSRGFTGRPEVHFDSSYLLYLALLISPTIAGGIGFFFARFHLRPSAALLSNGGFH